ncbi:MAG: hypothetical protein ACLFVJ_12405 [Persicimonas sp.]
MHISNLTKEPTHRLPRALAALLVAGLILTAASSAFALDGYADRKGIFAGLGFGGGIGGVDLQDGDGTAGFEEGRLPGLEFSGVLGGGLSENIVLGAQGNMWVRNVQKGSQTLAHRHSSLMAMGNFFLIEGLYVEAAAGLAYAAFDGQRGDNDLREYRELGFAARAAVGYEYFINGTHALGGSVGYTRHFYGNADFDTLSGTIGLRWY